jgi:predicted metal-dependent phosphotriesterase family hydrolase
MQTVNTVTGACLSSDLGRTLVHKHRLIGDPGWQMDALAPRFDREEARPKAIDKNPRRWFEGQNPPGSEI